MKRVVSFMLALLLIMSVSMTNTYAMSKNPKGLPPGIAKKNYLPPGIAKKFKDIDDYGWAEDAIERMVEKGVIKGIGDELFAPRSAVTKLEAVVMALRVMGEEEVATDYKEKIKYGKKKLKSKDRLQEWAYGYVALAEEKGILDEADILYFRLNEPAKRHEVAKYIVRALGYEDEAKDHMDADLDFKDASFIPQGSVGYVYVANKEGIITGYKNGTFMPLNTVTRAEMAVMVYRLDDKIDNDEDELKVYRGEVEEIDDDYEWIKIDIGSRDKKFDITNRTKVVFEDDEEGDIEDIQVGDEVKVKVNEDYEAVYIKVDKELYDEYKGEVEDIDNDYDWIEIKIGSRDRRFDITNRTEVVFEDDEEGDIEDIEVGDEVKVKVNEDNEAVYIEVDSELYDEYKGEVEEIDDDYDWIEIEIGSRDRRFDVTGRTKVVFKDNEEADIEDIEVGDEVRVKVNGDNEAVYIKVYRELYYQYEGEVEEIDDDYEWIEIEIGSRDRRFDITDDTKVVFEDDEEGDIEDIKVGDDVKVRVNEDDEVEYIEVDRELDYDIYEGLLIEIDDDEISILSSKDIISFEVDSNVKVEFKDRDGDLEDLMIGDEVKLIVDEDDDDEVQKIEVNRKYNSVGIAGKLINVYEDERQIAIKQDTKVKIYEYKSSVRVYVNDDTAKISDLEDDDNILLILDNGKVKEIRAYRIVVVD